MVAGYVTKKAAMAWVFVASLLLAGPAMAAVSAHLDRQVIGEGESVNLTIDINGDDSGEPDTAGLEKDFEILSRNQSSSYSLINGSLHSNVNWQLVLRPRHAGSLHIPALKVGDAQTQPLMLEVKQLAVRKGAGGQPEGDIWLDMALQPEAVLVQQQTIITIRIYQSAALAQAQLTEPAAEHAIIERLGEDKQYQVTKNGRNWQVTERNYALFPQQSGPLAIAPVQLDGAIVVNQQAMGSPFFQTSRPIRVRSNKLALQVNPIPAAWHGVNWLPSTGVGLTEQWPSDASFKVGEPITRTITLQAQGLSMSQLPALPGLLPERLKAYPDQPALTDDKSDRGITGKRREKTAIIPTAPGTYILPAIELPWWNVNSGRMETAELPARTFKVTGALTAIAPIAAAPTALLQPAQSSAAAPVAQPVTTTPESWWKPVAIVALCGWLLTLLYLFVKRRPHAKDDAQTAPADQNLKAARKAVRAACSSGDAKGCEQALLSFVTMRWPDAGGSLTPLRRYGGDALARQITDLEQHLYASSASAWQGTDLLAAFEQSQIHTDDKQSAAGAKALPGLYPDQ